MNVPIIAQRTKSLILSCTAGVGVIVTGWLSARCSRKADEKETRREKAIAYIPAVVSGGATIACIGLSTYISGEEIAALTLTCAATAQKFADYRRAVHENVGEEEEARINEAFYLKEIDRLEQELAEREHPTDDDDLCEFRDGYTPYSFKARYEDVEERLKEVMEVWKTDECLAWCQALYILSGGDTAPYYSPMGCSGGYWSGDYSFGWSKSMLEEGLGMNNALDRFDINIRPSERNPGVYQIEYSIMPEPDYMNW